MRTKTSICLATFAVLGAALTVHAGKAPYPEDYDGLIRPLPVSRIEPDYPAAALRDRPTGSVIAEITVTSKAQIKIDDLRCELIGERASADADCAALVKAARQAVKRWRYMPGYLNDRPVDVRLRVPIRFDPESASGAVTVDAPLAGRGRRANPVRTRFVKPAWPSDVDDHEARLVFEARIDKTGVPVSVVRLSCGVRDRGRKKYEFGDEPCLAFDRAARAAIADWRYEPVIVDDEPVDVYLTIRLDFERP